VSRDHLSVYLNDHLAGAQMGLELLALLRKMDDSNFWSEIEKEITADRDDLERLIGALGSEPSTFRRTGAWVSEKLAELKLRADDRSDGTLRRFELIEALALGIDGKEALWTALQSASARVPELRRLDYPRLIARAKAQRADVEARRLQAAAVALAMETAVEK
jgi:hypothetical protein